MSTGNYIYFAPLVAAAICLALLSVLVRSQSLPQDLPNDRSLHSAPVSRSGRLAMVCAIALTGPLFFYGVGTWLSLGGALALVSFADDWRNLSAKVRLTAHLLNYDVPIHEQRRSGPPVVAENVRLRLPLPTGWQVKEVRLRGPDAAGGSVLPFEVSRDRLLVTVPRVEIYEIVEALAE